MKSMKRAIWTATLRTAAIAIVLISSPSKAQDNTINFRGLPFGTTESELVAKLPYFSCRDAPNKEIADRVCTADASNNEAMMYASQLAKQIELIFINDGLVHIDVRFEFPTVLAMLDTENAILPILMSRYGKPEPKPDGKGRDSIDFTSWNLADGGMVTTMSFKSRISSSYSIAYAAPKYRNTVKERQLPRLKEQSKGM